MSIANVTMRENFIFLESYHFLDHLGIIKKSPVLCVNLFLPIDGSSLLKRVFKAITYLHTYLLTYYSLSSPASRGVVCNCWNPIRVYG